MMMSFLMLSLLVNILALEGRVVSPKLSDIEEYWNVRRKLIQDEIYMAIGGNFTLSNDDMPVNNALMNAKYNELEEAHKNPKEFPASQNFMQAKNAIDKSTVFQIIKKMPKGAVLHIHDKTMTSMEFLFKNITYQPHLFICDKNGVLSFRFLQYPKNDCDWQNLRILRRSKEKAPALNAKIYQQLSMLTKHPNTEYPDVHKSWDKLQNIFETLGPLLTYRPVFEMYIYQGLQELYDDNIMYAEIRSPLSSLYELNGTRHGVMKVMEIYERIINRFIKYHPDFVGIKLIYSRHKNLTGEQFNENLKTIQRLKRIYPELIAGFDLINDEEPGNALAHFVNELRSTDHGIQLFLHASEGGWGSDDNLIDAVLLNAKRISYESALLKHPKVMEQIQHRKLAVEVNSISNQMLKLVGDMRNHPASLFFAENFPIVISNDNPTVWGAKGLSYDFYEVFMGMMAYNSDLRSLKTLAINSIEYSSMDPQEKIKSFAMFEKQWKKFVENFDFD